MKDKENIVSDIEVTRETESGELFISRIFDAPPELMFELWTKPEHLVQWWGRHEMTMPVFEVDLRPGGGFRICMHHPKWGEHWVRGVYSEIVPPHKLVFTYALENEQPNHNAVATVTFKEHGSKTLLSFHQKLIDTAEARKGASEGWFQGMERIAALLKKLKYKSVK